MLIVEQNVDMALSIADHCCILENGRIVARYPVERVRAEPDLVHRHLAI